MKTRYIVQCLKHGMESKDWAGKMVVVGLSRSKKERRDGGCPYCRKDMIEARKAAQSVSP